MESDSTETKSQEIMGEIYEITYDYFKSYSDELKADNIDSNNDEKTVQKNKEQLEKNEQIMKKCLENPRKTRKIKGLRQAAAQTEEYKHVKSMMKKAKKLSKDLLKSENEAGPSKSRDQMIQNLREGNIESFFWNKL